MTKSMTESEAIEIVRQERAYMDSHAGRAQSEAFQMAINALEKQIEMKKYCDENGCTDCPYHNTSLKDNRCMNDFIIDKE